MVANYGFRDDEEDQKPIEVQATSPVIYYTTIGPPLPPFVRVLNVGLYQVIYDIATCTQTFHRKVNLLFTESIGYRILVSIMYFLPTPIHSEQTLNRATVHIHVK